MAHSLLPQLTVLPAAHHKITRPDHLSYDDGPYDFGAGCDAAIDNKLYRGGDELMARAYQEAIEEVDNVRVLLPLARESSLSILKLYNYWVAFIARSAPIFQAK